MIAVKHDVDDKVIAYVDYEIVDESGYQKEDGKFCYVRDIWVHRNFRYRYTLKEFVMEEHNKFPSVKWLYFSRKKYNDRMSQYDIMKFYKKENK